MVGNPLKADRATTQKQRLQFARILVEVEAYQEYPEVIMFENEWSEIMEQEMHYEWKPIYCASCENYERDIKECRKQIREGAEKEKNRNGIENKK